MVLYSARYFVVSSAAFRNRQRLGQPRGLLLDSSKQGPLPAIGPDPLAQLKLRSYRVFWNWRGLYSLA